MSKEPTRNGNYRSKAGGSGGRGNNRVLGNASAGDFSWAGVDAVELHAFVATVCGHGDMVSFSRTSDGGCGAICIISDGDRLKSYPKNADEVLKSFTDMIADMGYPD